MKFELSQKEIEKSDAFKNYHLNIILRGTSKFQYIFEYTGIGFRVWIKEIVSGDISELTDCDHW